ncbi:hypothetical protein ZWY2020_021985 [Hordeum vulgare]|nr:hypothetical protein ZWY2020_021985 [Hordeum vulgare]
MHPTASLFGVVQLRAQQEACQEEPRDPYTVKPPKNDFRELWSAIKEVFGPDEFEMEMHKLLQLRETGTVADYRVGFEGHMYNLLALDASVSPKNFVTQFLLWPRDDRRAAVRLHAPSIITRASVLARIQEEELDMPRPRPRPHPTGRPPPLLVLVRVRLQAAPCPDAANDEFARERQLHDHRRVFVRNIVISKKILRLSSASNMVSNALFHTES